jgi:hypothetical protein
MNKQLRQITILDGRATFIWDHVHEIDGVRIVRGGTEYSRDITATEPGLAAWVVESYAHAATVLGTENQRSADAEAARLAAIAAEEARRAAMTQEERDAEDEAIRLANLPPEPGPWRVSKDTLLGRIDAEGKTADCMAIIASLTPAEQFLWTNFAWFWSNNERIRGMITGVGLNPNTIMAPDPYAP